jgi:aminopeptidase N
MNIAATIKPALLISLLFFSFAASFAQNNSKRTRADSLKGSITPERAWWDVQRYDLELDIDLAQKRISGKNTITYNVLRKSSGYMQIDLQEPLAIDSIKKGKNKLKFTRSGGAAYLVNIPSSKESSGKIDIFYSGSPKESVKPPYDGGFVWTTDSLNRPWVSVACQLIGGSVWYPCKDHYSEEPDQGASLTITIPDSAGVAISNGKLKSKTSRGPGRTAYTWSVVNPINNYNITFYIGHYADIHQDYAGEKGTLPLNFWVLDYNYTKAMNHMIPEVRKMLKAFEKWFGPYPFYEDEFKIVEASYIGMEHQSAIAYGNKFKKGRFKAKNLIALDLQTDRLIVHETGHEWWGNNITMSDMADRWVQEGFTAYSEELFIEELFGRDAGREFYVQRSPKLIGNEQPLISPYHVFQDAGSDMYAKGWAIVHMLREMVNDDEKFRAYLRSLNRVFYHQNIYSHQLEKFTSDYFKTDYSKFFDQYLRFATIPVLEYRVVENKIEYRLTANVPELELRLRLSSQNTWIIAGTAWKTIALSGTPGIGIDPNFLVEVKKVD